MRTCTSTAIAVLIVVVADSFNFNKAAVHALLPNVARRSSTRIVATTASRARTEQTTPPSPPLPEAAGAAAALYVIAPKENMDSSVIDNATENQNPHKDEILLANNDALLFEEEEATIASLENRSSTSKQDNTITKDNNGIIGDVVWRGVVVVLCALWASNFAAAKLIIGEPNVDSSLYALVRFSVAALALLPFCMSTIRRTGMDIETAKDAAICGSWVAFGYLGQTMGLLTTTASRSCVICSLHCVFVAIVAEWMRVSRTEEAGRRTSFDTKRLAPAALAVMGVAIVELQGAGGAPTIGDVLSFAQPIGFGMGYLQLEELMSRRPDLSLPVAAIKLGVVALASLFMFELTPLWTTAADTVVWTPQVPDLGAILSSRVALGGILYTGLVTTALALWVESIAFARVPATDASIILTTEPLFAALFGAISLGETFGMSDYVGASLIVGACVLAAVLDNPGDKECIVEEDPSCEPPRKWPFWGF